MCAQPSGQFAAAVAAADAAAAAAAAAAALPLTLYVRTHVNKDHMCAHT